MVVENLSLDRINASSPYRPQTVVDEEGNENNAALIIRKDNPQFADLVSEFMATVNLLNAKPGEDDV